MKRARRGLSTLVGGAAVAMTLSAALAPGNAPAAPVGAAITPVRVAQAVPVSIVHTCSQVIKVRLFTCFAERRTDLGFTSRQRMQATPNATPSGYGPSSLQSAYALPSSSAGAGQRVYIVDAYDDPTAESDLAAYRSQYGLAACTTANGCFKKLNQSGATSPLPASNSGWAGEISLDVDMVSAVCPKCAITLMEATSATDANLFTAVKTATNLGAKFVSMSFGGPESSSNATLDSQYLQPSGVVYTASTGDAAYQDGVEYPAASAYTVAVGGTSLKSASNARGWTEAVWKTNTTEGTGSGCSGYTAKPSWQSNIATSVCAKRAVADVSAVADPATGVAVYQTTGGSGWAVYGGTSASSPIVASVYALAGTPASSDKPASFPYAHTGSLNDVTTGNNGTCSPSLLCTAATGWDGPTGLGTPNGTAAFKSGTGGTGNTVTVTNPGTQSATVGTAKSLQISAGDSGGSALTFTATGLPAGLSISTSGLISGTPTTAGSYSTTVTAKDTTNASGSTTFAFTIAAAGGGCASPGQKLLNPGFESGATSWTTTTGVINTDGAHAHAGSGYAWLDGYGSTHTDTLAQSVAIPAGCTVTLTYYLYISSSEGTSTAYDKLALTANGTTVQSFSNVNQGTGYVQRTVTLSSYAGTTVALKWTGTEDSSTATSFFIDDTALTAR